MLRTIHVEDKTSNKKLNSQVLKNNICDLKLKVLLLNDFKFI